VPEGAGLTARSRHPTARGSLFGTVPSLGITDLLANSPVDPTAHVDPERVARYAEDFDALPPVVVFGTEDGLLLVDGYHRIAAAQRLGAVMIAAEVHQGSRADALRYVTMTIAGERGISADDAMNYVLRRARTG
jgi:ParB-like chromosome segregation protein Spo0J